MGAFVLLRREQPEFHRRRDAVLGELALQGFRAPKVFEAAGCVIHLYPKLSVDNENAYAASPDCFCLSVGTFYYRGAIGTAALEQFLRDFEPPRIPWDDLRGQFCLIVAKGGSVHLFTDRMGFYRVYCSADGSVVSSSFLALAGAATRRTIDRQGVYEYVFLGTTYGRKTVFAEVEVADPDRMLVFDGARPATRSHAPIAFGFDAIEFEDAVRINVENLRRHFDAVTRPFGGRISTAITSGYDSRLMLALLRERGLQPYVYVYGAENDLDVQIARRIADGEGFPLAHTDRRAGPSVDAESFGALVEANYRLFDGYPVDGIFDNGSDARTRHERCRDGALPLNGIGGEYFRRPDLPNLPFRVRDVVWRSYSKIALDAVTSAFREDEYVDALARDIKRTLGTDDDVLPRSAIALLQAAFEARYWAGRNSNVNNRIGYALLAFCDLAIVQSAIRIPIAYKWYGRLEAALICAIDPRLASYDSRYGHAFSDPPPLGTVVEEWRKTVRPPVCSRYIRTARAYPQPHWLDDAHVEAVIDPSFPYLNRFFRIELIRGSFHYNRICTLEYLFERCSAGAD